MMLAAAERNVSDWLAEPRRSGSVLSLLGPVGMGKTALLRRMHERFPSSIFMDCSGLTMDEVTRRLLAEFGIDAVDPRSKDPLFDAVVKIRRDAVVVLANVHWSGPLFTSRGSATASRARWPRHPVRTAADVCAWSSKPTRPVIACESDGRTRSDGTAALAHRMVTLASVRRLRHAPGHERGRGLRRTRTQRRRLRGHHPARAPATGCGALATPTGIGFPALDDGSEPKWLTTVDLDQTGLEPLDAPGHTEPAYLLGYWLGEKVFLGGDSGRILLASAVGVRLLGSSLRQFMTLVSLYISLRRSEFSTPYEEEDARRSLAAWARHIDQPAGSSRSWTAAFDGGLDVPESLCGRRSPDGPCAQRSRPG